MTRAELLLQITRLEAGVGWPFNPDHLPEWERQLAYLSERQFGKFVTAWNRTPRPDGKPRFPSIGEVIAGSAEFASSGAPEKFESCGINCDGGIAMYTDARGYDFACLCPNERCIGRSQRMSVPKGIKYGDAKPGWRMRDHVAESKERKARWAARGIPEPRNVGELLELVAFIADTKSIGRKRERAAAEANEPSRWEQLGIPEPRSVDELFGLIESLKTRNRIPLRRPT